MQRPIDHNSHPIDDLALVLTIHNWVIISATGSGNGVLSSPKHSPQDYLNLHNATRADVSVGPVSWDDTVAAYAQSFAAQVQRDCEFTYSPVTFYGENIFWSSDVATSASDAVGAWVSEKQFYDHDSNSCTGPGGFASCGHYTQVVWRDSSAIGCARVVCDKANDFGACVLITCNYNPPGNVIGRSPY